jgi:hypothetical protein
MLGLPSTTPAVAASAQTGSGVRETLVLAIRAAADLAQRQLLDGTLVGVEKAETASDLHQRLLAVDEEQRIAMHSRGPRDGEAPAPGEVPERLVPPPLVAPREAMASGEWIFPDANVEAVWPPATGRASLQEFRAALPVRVESGHAEGVTIVFRAGTWRLVTRREWSFESFDDGRGAMVQRVRARVALGALRPAGEVVALQKESGAYRLWSLAPRLRTLDEWISRAIEREDEDLLSTALGGYALGLVNALLAGLGSERPGALAPDNFGLAEGRLSYLDELSSPDADPSGVALAVLAPAELTERFPGALADYVAVIDEALSTQAKLAAVLRASLEVCRPSCARGVFLRDRWLQALAEVGG